MTTFSVPCILPRTFTPSGRTRVLAKRLRALWRDVGIGLALAAVGLVLTGLAIQAGGAWMTADLARPVVQQGVTVTPALFSPDAVPVP